jgi:hypothetical protein
MISEFYKRIKFLSRLHHVVITCCRRVLREFIYCNNLMLIRGFVKSWKEDRKTHTQYREKDIPIFFSLKKIAGCKVSFFSAQFQLAHQKNYKH